MCFLKPFPISLYPKLITEKQKLEQQVNLPSQATQKKGRLQNQWDSGCCYFSGDVLHQKIIINFRQWIEIHDGKLLRRNTWNYGKVEQYLFYDGGEEYNNIETPKKIIRNLFLSLFNYLMPQICTPGAHHKLAHVPGRAMQESIWMILPEIRTKRMAWRMMGRQHAKEIMGWPGC